MVCSKKSQTVSLSETPRFVPFQRARHANHQPRRRSCTRPDSPPSPRYRSHKPPSRTRRCNSIAWSVLRDALHRNGSNHRCRHPLSKRQTSNRSQPTAAITKGCKQRCIYISAPKLIAALERYLEFRWTNRIGAWPDRTDAAYRGLRHDLPLFITRKGAKFELNIKRRILETGEYREYLAADSLQSYITRLYAKAGIKGGIP